MDMSAEQPRLKPTAASIPRGDAMARLEHVRLVNHVVQVQDGQVLYSPARMQREQYLPQIFWSDHVPWLEANLWAHERAVSREVDIQTVETNMRALVHYANFLESENLKWYEFPTRKADRCLVKYRGYLLDARESGALAPSTVSARMGYVIAFYRWAKQNSMLRPDISLWNDRSIFIKYFDSVGFERTLARVTTDLSIPNRTRISNTVEDGLLPVSSADRDRILTFAKESSSIELFLMLSCGFFTGMRLGTLCDLKVESLDCATPDPMTSSMYHIPVGPGATIPVHTKFGVTGQVWISKELLGTLRDYASSVHRFSRQQKAPKSNKNLLFLTRFGNSYGRGNSDRSSAINVELSRLRRNGASRGLPVLRNFHFHQTRCTFGTELARLAMNAHEEISALAFVRDALLHKDEATTLKYIKFVKNAPLKKQIADAFTAAFIGTLFTARTNADT